MNALEPIDIRTGRPFGGRRAHMHRPPIDGASIEGNRLVTGRARGLVGGAFMGAMLASQGGAFPYPQRGLLLCFDGIWNTGIGKHDSNASSWFDLAGTGYKYTVNKDKYSFTPNGVRALVDVPGGLRLRPTKEFIQLYSEQYTSIVAIRDNVATGANTGVRYMSLDQSNYVGRFYSNLLAHSPKGSNDYITMAEAGLTNLTGTHVWTSTGASGYGTDYYVDGSKMVHRNGFALYGTIYYDYGRNDITIFEAAQGGSNTAYTGSECYCMLLYNRKMDAEEVSKISSAIFNRFNLP